MNALAHDRPAPRRVVIVGGGIAGLAVAHRLAQAGAAARGIEVVVLERASRPGGNIRTDVVEGFTCEWGPNGFLDNAPATLALVHDLGLDGRLQPSEDGARTRYIFRDGVLHAVPGGPMAFVTSELLSWRAKLRIACEPFAHARPDGDETIHAFASRRIGSEAADVMIDAMVSGIFGGDARALSLRACFPKMWDLETEHGGLFRALLARRRRRPRARGEAMGAPLGRLTSFTGGAEDLVRALAARLGAVIRTDVDVRAVARVGDAYRVDLAGEPSLAADVVVLAGGASSSARLVRGLDETLASTFDDMPSAGMAVVCLGFDAARLNRPLDGFGFLVPRREGIRTLGVLWDSSVYAGRAPKGHVLMRAMIGGATDPDAVRLDEDVLTTTVRADLRVTMGLTAAPSLVKVIRHPGGIPQYTVGHLDRVARAEARLAAFPGLFLAGSGYRGVSINACIADAPAVAERVLASVAGRVSASATDPADRQAQGSGLRAQGSGLRAQHPAG